MTALDVTGVWKAFAGTNALVDVSFQATGGRVHCLLGGNGSGKSTLVKILAGVQPADRGTVRVGDRDVDARAITPAWAREHNLWFVHQDLAVFGAVSVAENLVAGREYPTRAGGMIRWRRLHAQAAEILERFHIPVDPRTPLAALRPAHRTMVAIARALDACTDAAGALVLDEPTAALPRDDVRSLLSALRRYADDGHAIVLVTHRLDEVEEVADDVTVLRDGSVVASGPAMHDRPALAELIVGSAAETAVRTPRGPATAGRVVLELDGVGTGRGTRIDLRVSEGEVVGVAGRLGSGRSRLLRCVFGAEPRAGQVRVDGRVLKADDVPAAIAAGMAYVPEDRDHDGLFPALDVRENLSVVDLPAFRARAGLNYRREATAAAQTLTAFRIRAASDRQPIMTLSGGNRQKVLLGRWLRTAPRVLLLDEPTQGVDVGARAEIHGMIQSAAAKGAAVLLVSSDHEELEQLSSRVIVLADGVLTAELDADAVDAAHISHLALAATTPDPEGSR